MNRLFKRLGIFLAINAAIALIASLAPPAFMNKGFDSVAVVFDFIDTIGPDEHLNLIIGDSRSEWRIEADRLGFVNLSFPGVTPVESYYLLQKTLAQGASVDRLILSLGPNHILGQDSFHGWTRYFGLIESDYLDTVMAEVESLEDEQYLDYRWPALEVIDSHVPWLPDSLKFRVVNVLSIDETVKMAVMTAASVIVPGASATVEQARNFKLYFADPETTVNNFDYDSPESENPTGHSPLNELYLQRLIDLARENNISVSYLLMPMNKDVAQPESDYFERFSSVIEDAGLGSCMTPLLWWPNDHFSDSNHLNLTGVQAFNADIDERLRYCE